MRTALFPRNKQENKSYWKTSSSYWFFFVLLDATRIIVTISWPDHFSNIEIFVLFDTELLSLTKAPFSHVPNNSAPNFKDVEQRFP